MKKKKVKMNLTTIKPYHCKNNNALKMFTTKLTKTYHNVLNGGQVKMKSLNRDDFAYMSTLRPRMEVCAKNNNVKIEIFAPLENKFNILLFKITNKFNNETCIKGISSEIPFSSKTENLNCKTEFRTSIMTTLQNGINTLNNKMPPIESII